MKSFGSNYRACVIGASGAIGAAMLAYFENDPACEFVHGVRRKSAQDGFGDFDLRDEASIARYAEQLQVHGPFHCIVVATGVLHNADFMPEKKLGDLNSAQMQETFLVNAIGPALVLRYFSPLLAKERSVFACLSAKVGSIQDNRLGGWYSYRASKAALNMMLKTASIELARTKPNTVVVALHPGTVNSALSKPFKGEQIGHPAKEAAAELLAQIDQTLPSDSGTFVAYNGERLPW